MSCAGIPLIAAISAGLLVAGCGSGSVGDGPGGWGGPAAGAPATSSGGSGASGSGTDASATGTPPSAGADAASSAGRKSDGGDATDGAARGGDAASVDAGPPEDTGSAANTFTLIDTNVSTIVDGEPVSGWDPIAEDSTIDLAKVGTALSIRANTTPAVVGSVGFLLDRVTAHTENAVPYTLCSDNGAGLITPCVLATGSHTLTITPYSAADLGGTAMPSTTLYFTIEDSATDGGADAPTGG